MGEYIVRLSQCRMKVINKDGFSIYCNGIYHWKYVVSSNKTQKDGICDCKGGKHDFLDNINRFKGISL